VSSFFIASPYAFVLLRDATATTPGECGSKQFVPRKNETSQFAYEAIRKQASFAEPVAVNLRPGAGAIGMAKMLVVVLGLSAAAIFIAERPRSAKAAANFRAGHRA
jgi:hypothetical protein